MTREEIENKAKQLGQECFPDENNVWARPNIEAQKVEYACIEMAKYTQRQMINKACSFTCSHCPLRCRATACPDSVLCSVYSNKNECDTIKSLTKVMEEQV